MIEANISIVCHIYLLFVHNACPEEERETLKPLLEHELLDAVVGFVNAVVRLLKEKTTQLRNTVKLYEMSCVRKLREKTWFVLNLCKMIMGLTQAKLHLRDS